MHDIDPKLLSSANTARVIHMAEQFIFPFLEQRIALESEQMSAQFLEGKDTTHKVAYISALICLRNELTLLMKRGDLAAAKLNSP